MELLKKVKQEIEKHSIEKPDQSLNLNQITEKGGGIAQYIDKTLLYPVGKILLEIHDIENFEWEGESANVYLRITLNPYVLFSKQIDKNTYGKCQKKKDGSHCEKLNCCKKT